MIKTSVKKGVALTGGFAVGEAMRQINPDVVAMYPITPQTPIVEYFAIQAAKGKVDTEVITVESEHSAMSACIGASAAGARAMTASSSQGIMYMMEMLPIAAAMRLPIVMAVATRAISGPLNIHGDHSDAMAMRDHGWVQIFSESVQEAYDNTLIAQKLAEKVLLPTTVNLDGFFTSHSVENLEMLDDKSAKKFVGEYKPKQSLLDFKNPITLGSLVLPNAYFEFRKQIWEAMETAREAFADVAEDYGKLSGRKYEPIETYKTKDADRIIVAMGSACGTIKEVIDLMREKGKKVGLVKVRLFRPFPHKEMKKALKDTQDIIVMDRNMTFGTQPVLATEVEHAVGRPVRSIVYGLGGRDLYENQVQEILEGKVKGSFLM